MKDQRTTYLDQANDHAIAAAKALEEGTDPGSDGPLSSQTLLSVASVHASLAQALATMATATAPGAI